MKRGAGNVLETKNGDKDELGRIQWNLYLYLHVYIGPPSRL